jgi:hypothetical protein
MTGSAKPITVSYTRAVTNYRPNFICGGSFFFTANLAERRLRLLVDYIVLLRQAFRYLRASQFASKADVRGLWQMGEKGH